jgi:hypothetical protein
MRRRMRCTPGSTLIALLACAAACSEEGTDLPTAPAVPEPSEVTDFRQGFALSWCTYLEECETTDDRALAYSLGGKAECVAFYAAFIDSPGWRELDRLIELGHIRFDRDRYVACHERMRATCSPELATCDSSLIGLRNLGDACNSNEECPAAAYCEGSDAACGGRCAPQKSAGEMCTYNTHCASGTAIGEGAECDGGVCRPTRIEGTGTEGATCGVRDDGATRAHVSCTGGLHCERATNTCQRPLAPNTACERDDLCARGHDCVGGQCRALTRVGSGQACDDVARCRRSDGLHCVAGTCEARMDQPRGSGCVASAECADGVSCTNGRCGTAAAIGEACESSESCDSGKCRDDICADHGC